LIETIIFLIGRRLSQVSADISQGIKLFPLTVLAKKGERGFRKQENPLLPKADFAGISV